MHPQESCALPSLVSLFLRGYTTACSGTKPYNFFLMYNTKETRKADGQGQLPKRWDRIRTAHRLSLMGNSPDRLDRTREKIWALEPLGGFEFDTKIRLTELIRDRPCAQKDGKEPS